ncbi:trypsin-like peptidase domain-containing protein [Candidatus Saccharibacteria bacterium]|nr:trypsin-like peptidase domain-containing protein [Candidatus Saccharibacteria bacterium]
MENNSQDWRNYGNKNVLKKDVPGVDHSAERERRTRNAGVIVLCLISLLIGAAGVTVGVIALLNSGNSKNTTTTTASIEGYYQGNSVEFEETSIANIVSKVTPAVVSIITETRSSSSYYNLFGGGSSTQQSAGTGMIVTSDGYVLTNKHVIDGASKVQVITDAGDTYTDVEIVGTDPLNDVAYLKIKNVKDLPTVTLGDSKTVAVGQPVLAIGNALGAYQNTVTQGVISGTGRSLEASDSNGKNSETLTDMLQTDAAINPGNSGGPLVNAAGDVIGINTAVSTSANGLGFAIPISATKGMLNRIIAGKSAQRAYLNMTYATVTPSIAKKNNLPVSQGAYINKIGTGGPADEAGLKEKDIITKVGNIEVGRAGSISTLIGEYQVGDKVEITYRRGDETKTTIVTLAGYAD